MNHPDREELLAYLDGELPRERRTEVAEHLATCGECSELATSWDAARTALSGWKLPASRALAQPARLRVPPRRQNAWTRAVAATVLVALGFSAARLTAPRADLSGLQSELRAEFAELTSQQRANQEAFLQAIGEQIDQLDAQWLADYAALRRDVETVALRTQAEFERLATSESERENLP
jgi:anti-sigma factor RsiW